MTTDTVIKMTLDKFPEQGVPYKAWRPAPGLNYLVYDSHRDAPVAFAIRVGKKASVYLVEKHIAGKNMKIPVGHRPIPWKPFADHVGVDAVAERNGRDRRARRQALRNNLLLNWRDRCAALLSFSAPR